MVTVVIARWKDEKEEGPVVVVVVVGTRSSRFGVLAAPTGEQITESNFQVFTS